MRLGFIGDILRFILDAIYSVVPNYGWTVILFTLFIRLCLLPLDIKSKRGMRRTQMIQPKIDALNKKYANDKEKLNQKMSELYRTEKINPMAGCLPMLIQMPILFSMFAVMREVTNEQTVNMILEIKNVFESAVAAGDMSIFMDYRPVYEGFLWIKNVLQPDAFWSTTIPTAENALLGIAASGNITAEMIEEASTFLSAHAADYTAWANAAGNEIIYSAPALMWQIQIPRVFNGLFILPILSCVTQFLSSKLMNPAGEAQKTNANANANSQMMKYFFPLFSLWICASSNAAFAVYWVAVNIIQIVQQFVLDKWFAYQENKKTLSEEAK